MTRRIDRLWRRQRLDRQGFRALRALAVRSLLLARKLDAAPAYQEILRGFARRLMQLVKRATAGEEDGLAELLDFLQSRAGRLSGKSPELPPTHRGRRFVPILECYVEEDE